MFPLTKMFQQSVYHLPSVKQWPHNTMLQSDWLMLYIEYKFFTGGLPTLGQCRLCRPKRGWAYIGCHHQTDGCADVRPTLPLCGNAICDIETFNISLKLHKKDDLFI